MLKNGKVINEEAEEISHDKVVLKGGESVYFDYLVVAIGSSYNFPAKLGGTVFFQLE